MTAKIAMKWVKPEVRRLAAGAAELQLGTGPDAESEVS